MFLYQMAMSLFHVPDQLSHPNRSITGTVQPVSPFSIGCLVL
jgi:hypothetical protein